MRYKTIYYDKDSGIIAMAELVSGLPVDLGQPLETQWPHLHAIRADGTPGTQYVKDGAVRDLPQRPSLHHAWDLAAEAWVDPRSAEDVAADNAVALEEARTAALARALELRAAARLLYITDIPGQDAIYASKLEEARAYLADAEPVAADYPLIWSEVGVTAPTAIEVAQVFLNLNALWKAAAAAIDGAYFGAQAAIMAASNGAEMQAALDALAGAFDA